MRSFTLALLVPALFVLAACSAKTTAPTEVTYRSAVLHAEVHCDSGDRGASRFVIREAGTSAWNGVDDWFDFTAACANGRVPASGTLTRPATATGLRSSQGYEAGFQWRRPDGVIFTVGTNENDFDGPYETFTTAAFPTSVPAANAGKLHAGTGVNTRSAYSCTPMAMDTRGEPPYPACSASQSDYAATKWALDYLDVRYVRDMLWPTWHTKQRELFRELGAAGIKGTINVCDLQRYRAERGTWCDPNWAQLGSDPALRAFIDRFEGPNEPDLYSPFPGWPQALRDYMVWHEQKQTEAGMAATPLAGPTFTSPGAAATVGVLPQADLGAAHPYPANNEPPESQRHGRDDYCAVTAPGKPCQFTEVGYHSEINDPTSGNKGVDAGTRAAYTLRYLLESRRWGIDRTDLYKLVAQAMPRADGTCADPTNNDVTSDDWQMFDCRYRPLPIAEAVRNFQLTVGAGNVTSPAPVKISGLEESDGPAHLRRAVFRQPDGDGLVILWRHVDAWNGATHQPNAIAPVTLDYEVPVGTSVKIVRPVTSAEEQDPAAPGKVTVGRDPVILVLR